jgi:hypothetical protein
MERLLTRDEFRTAVFERDNFTCLVCPDPAVDAHHIMERRLWTDGGYYLSNGASLCAYHHLLAEQTLVTPWELREYAGITKVLTPDALYTGDYEYDKWGNAYLPNGMRAPGELFYDESVQKVLAPVLDQFTKYVKYPRTPHLPTSPGFSDEDINWTSDEHMHGIEVVVTEKMDGENTTMYDDHIHARSLTDMSYHASRTWVKNLHGSIAHNIPQTYRICGENLYAKHSLAYENLSSYFMVFSIWDGANCLSWDETTEWCDLLGLTHVPVLYYGTYDDLNLDIDTDTSEGYVVRPAESFVLSKFRSVVAKWVRPDHINSDHHWIHKHVVQNKIGA